MFLSLLLFISADCEVCLRDYRLCLIKTVEKPLSKDDLKTKQFSCKSKIKKCSNKFKCEK